MKSSIKFLKMKRMPVKEGYYLTGAFAYKKVMPQR